MTRFWTLALIFCLGLSSQLEAQSPKPTKPLIHIQTNKSLIRLGETLWFRVHMPPSVDARSITLSLEDASGHCVLKESFKKKGWLASGQFFINPKMPGGPHTLVARRGQEIVHSIPIELYDLQPASLKLSLSVLHKNHQPGSTVTATFEALDRKNRPLIGIPVRYRASFGPLVINGDGPKTNADGRALLRFKVPEQAQQSGTLAVGLKHKKAIQAVAHKVPVSASVARVDVFPQGGTVRAEGSHRMALLVRDLGGQAVFESEGRVFDDKNECQTAFITNARGHALIDLELKKDRQYHIRIDRPAGVTKTFPIPKATGHGVAIKMTHIPEKNRNPTQINIELSSGRNLKGSLLLVEGDRILKRKALIRDKTALWSFSEPSSARVLHVLYIRDQRVILRAPLFVGQSSDRTISIEPVMSPQPGQVAALKIRTLGGPTDLAISVTNNHAMEHSPALPSLRARSLFEPHIVGRLSDAQDLLPINADARERCQAFLMIRSGYQFPKGGLPVLKNKAGEPILPSPDLHRLSAPKIAPRPPIKLPKNATIAKATKLDKALIRAAYTRTRRLRPEHAKRQFERLHSGKHKFKSPGLGKASKKPPQKSKASRSQFDNRDTMFWQGRVITNERGEALIKFRTTQELSDLKVSAHGFQGLDPVSFTRTVKAQSGFTCQFKFPEHVRVGDQITAYFNVIRNDSSKAPFKLTIFTPRCLKALDPTAFKLDPRKHSLTRKVRFQVVAPMDSAELIVDTIRGLFRERLVHSFLSQFPDMEMSVGESGLGGGETCLSVAIPSDAIPGSVEVHSRVATSPAVSAAEGLESILREPHGCFEQTSSSNYPNLEILAMLRDTGQDGQLLETATKYATKGFKRILSFQDAHGGFRLWAGQGKAKAHYTAMAVMQLSLYSQLFDGQGTKALQRALRWLKLNKVESEQALYVNFALSMANRTLNCKPFQKTLRKLKPRTNYEWALYANALISNTDKDSQEALRKAATTLLKRSQNGQLVSSKGEGVMGSMGHCLSLETTALAALVFEATGHKKASFNCLAQLLKHRSPHGGWYGTQATALAIRAVSRLHQKVSAEVPEIKFSLAGKQRRVWHPNPARNRAMSYHARVQQKPGSALTMRLMMPKTALIDYNFAVKYRTRKLISSRKAPVRLTTSLSSRIVSLGDELTLKLHIVRVKDAPGQFVARVGLPGGCSLTKEFLESSNRQFEHMEITDGQLVLYFEQIPHSDTLSIPLRAQVAGNYQSSPSLIQPYYQAKRQSVCAGLSLKIHDIDVDEDAAAKKLQGMRGLGGR